VDKILSFLLRLPFTLVMLSVVAMAGMFTNTTFEQITHHWLNRVGFAPNDLWYWRLDRVFASALVTSGGVVFWEALFFVAFCVGLAEWMTGWKRTAVTFWGVHLLALVLLSLIFALAVNQLPNIGLEAVTLARDVGPSAGYFACLGLVSARLNRPWHWASGAALLAVFMVALWLPPRGGETAEVKLSADLAHLLAFTLGWLSSWIAFGPCKLINTHQEQW
jgi:hypothetical protein